MLKQAKKEGCRYGNLPEVIFPKLSYRVEGTFFHYYSKQWYVIAWRAYFQGPPLVQANKKLTEIETLKMIQHGGKQTFITRSRVHPLKHGGRNSSTTYTRKTL